MLSCTSPAGWTRRARRKPVLRGTEIAGILGALIAIPVAGSIQAIIGELIQRRDERRRSVVMG